MDNLKLSIIKSLYFSSPQSIAELSSSIGKSVPNITNSIHKLLQSDLIQQDGLAPSTGGRRAAQFIPNSQQLPLIVCVAIDQFYTSVVVTDFKNEFQTEISTKRIPLKGENAYEELVAFIRQTMLLVQEKPIYGIGVSIPGFVDSKSGKNNSFTAESTFYDFQANLGKTFNLPVFIENDSSAIAIAEHYFGQAKDARNVMVVNLNWGVGLGMIIDNELYRGHSGYAGEFSHIPLSNQNKLCSCGKKGCLEVEASLIAAIEFATEKLSKGEESSLLKDYQQQNNHITGDQLLTAANAGDQLAIEAISRIGYMLGKGIATLIHIINPEMVVVSGRGAQAKTILAPQINSALLEFTIQRLSKNTKIQFSNTKHIQLLGSACVCIGNSDKSIYKNYLTEI